MKLQKRDCDIKIKLHPTGTKFLGIDLDFAGHKIAFGASSAVSCGQFGDFVSALYTLFFEKNDCHNEWNHREYHTKEGSNHIVATTTTVDWDNEGEIMTIKMTKHYEGEKSNSILLRITTDYGDTFEEFSVNEKDLCYATAKACTDVLKQYGIYGYRYSTEHDTFNFHQLLFIKAYALDCLETRDLLNGDEHGFSKKTDFNKEMELLLFDM